jgi:hypothetical protein
MRNVVQIKKNLMPESCIEKVENRMLGSAHIKVYAAICHPVLLGLCTPRSLGVPRVAKTEVVPAGARPLWHRI